MRSIKPVFIKKYLSLTLVSVTFLCGQASALEYVKSDEIQNLTTNSPFIPTGFDQSKVGSTKIDNGQSGIPLSNLELRGIVKLDGEYIFCLQDKNSNDAFWVGMNESYEDMKIVDYDPLNYTVVVMKEGNQQKISLAKTIHPTNMTNINQLPDTERSRRKNLFQQLSQISKNDLEAIKNKKRPQVPTRRTRVRKKL
jgi:hypothetical protein